MIRKFVFVVVALLYITVFIAAAPQQGWKLPPNAAQEKNPLPINDALMAAGKKLFQSKCTRCHGPEGKGDGPDADADHKERMDLTNPKYAGENPDGVVFHKVAAGRAEPRMPAFEDQMSKEQIWAVVGYVQTLRKK